MGNTVTMGRPRNRGDPHKRQGRQRIHNNQKQEKK